VNSYLRQIKEMNKKIRQIRDDLDGDVNYKRMIDAEN
jgi:hypothetical protein